MAAVLGTSLRLDDPRARHLSALHARFAEPLQRFFRSYRLNTADVEDLTQDVFMRLAGPCAQAELRKPESFVFTLALNLVRDRARRLHTRALPKSVALDKVDLSCQRPTPDQSLEFEQRLKLVELTLAGLKPSVRDAFLMHRVYGESHAQIAGRMNISISMVEKHIMSATACLLPLIGA
jgi:RNA polymerase sigma factor (sigma-70 family)